MIMIRRSIVLALMATLVASGPCLAQSAAASATQPLLTSDEMERFLLQADIVATRLTKKGVTEARRVTLFDGRIRHDAQLQDVDIALPIFNVGPKYSEVNFKDTYRYNIAGYRLSQLLGLDNVPMSVERKVNGKPAAMTWWLDDYMMDEGDRQKKKTAGPSPSRTASQLHILRVFDELIQNRDRNAGNLLWTSDWKMWMIDHTRAFRLGKDLLKKQPLERVERTLLEKMRELTFPGLTDAMGKILTKEEVEALLARRDVIVKLFDDRIAQRGEATVLFTMGN
jgi:Trp operon repressor